MIRAIEADDRRAIEALREHLAYTDPDLLDAAIEGPFLGRVAVESDRIVGYALGFPARTTVISELVVDPAFRREGHGRALVEAIASASGGDRVAVTTPIKEGGARRFYADLGFECDERVRGFYADGTDALRFVRRE